jgi:hypothetical protein
LYDYKEKNGNKAVTMVKVVNKPKQSVILPIFSTICGEKKAVCVGTSQHKSPTMVRPNDKKVTKGENHGAKMTKKRRKTPLLQIDFSVKHI